MPSRTGSGPAAPGGCSRTTSRPTKPSTTTGGLSALHLNECLARHFVYTFTRAVRRLGPPSSALTAVSRFQPQIPATAPERERQCDPGRAPRCEQGWRSTSSVSVSVVSWGAVTPGTRTEVRDHLVEDRNWEWIRRRGRFGRIRSFFRIGSFVRVGIFRMRRKPIAHDLRILHLLDVLRLLRQVPALQLRLAAVDRTRVVMDYDNRVYGPDNIDTVFAHETGHVSGCPTSTCRQYLTATAVVPTGATASSTATAERLSLRAATRVARAGAGGAASPMRQASQAAMKPPPRRSRTAPPALPTGPLSPADHLW